MGFFNTLSQSWKEYKLNFKTIISIMLLFYAVPFIISLFINASIVSKLQSAIALGTPANKYFLLAAIVGIILYLINHMAYVGILASSISKKPFTFTDTLKNGKHFYWKMLGLFILLGIILGVLAIPFAFITLFLIGDFIFAKGVNSAPFWISFLIFLPLFILSIYLFIKWLLAPYALVNEKTGIFASMKRSSQIVKSKWWRTFAWLILAGILASIFSTIISIPYFLVAKYSSSALLAILLKILTDLTLTLILMPMTIIFFKDMYLNFKK